MQTTRFVVFQLANFVLFFSGKYLIGPARGLGNVFDTVQAIYDFFGHSIVRWRKLQNAASDEVMAGLRNLSSTVTLKTLNPTRFAGRRDAILR